MAIEINPIFQQALAGVDVIQIASDLVKIPSCSQTRVRENDVSAYLYKWLNEEGIAVEVTEALPGRFNVTGVLQGSDGGRSLMLCGHMDTVPAYDMQDPHSGLVENGVLHGRGACDMKGPLASMLAAFLAIKRSNVRLKGDLIFAAVIDEEEMGKGVDYLALHGPFVDGAVIGEPTSMRLALGHKGLEWIRIEVIGKKVHGGKMDLGINAISMAGRLIDKIVEEYTPQLKERNHPLLGHPTINIGRIEGGDQPSTVPGSCTLEIDRRWIPGESLDQVYRELGEIIDRLQKEDPRFKAEVKGYYPAEELLPHHPFCTEVSDPLVVSAMRTLEAVGLTDLEPTAFPAWSDAGILAGCTKAKCIVMGPGDLALAHTAAETIEVNELEKAAHFYGQMAMDYCGKDI